MGTVVCSLSIRVIVTGAISTFKDVVASSSATVDGQESSPPLCPPPLSPSQPFLFAAADIKGLSGKMGPAGTAGDRNAIKRACVSANLSPLENL